MRCTAPRGGSRRGPPPARGGRRRRRARLSLIGGGIAYLGVTLYGALVEHDSDANFLPINDADNLLHLGLVLAMIALGLVGTRLSKDRPATRA